MTVKQIISQVERMFGSQPEKYIIQLNIASVNKLKSNNIEAGTQLRVPVFVEEAILK